MESRSKSESPRTVFVNSVLIIQRKFCAECSNAFPEPVNFTLNIWTQARPGRTVQTFRPFLLTSLAPGITKNDSSSTAPEAVSQPINSCAAQHSGQIPVFEGKTCSHGRLFTS